MNNRKPVKLVEISIESEFTREMDELRINSFMETPQITSKDEFK